MHWIEKTITWLFPTVVLAGSPWKHEWEELQRIRFIKLVKVVLPGILSIYVGHYLFVAASATPESSERWFPFSFSFPVACFIALAFYFTPFARRDWCRLPALLIMATACVSQSIIYLYYPSVTWAYPFVLVFASVIVLRMTPLNSAAFAFLVSLAAANILVSAGVDVTAVGGGMAVTVFASVIVRSSYQHELENFLLNKKLASKEKGILDLQKEFADRISSFIPKEIAKRIDNLVNEKEASVLEASIEVLEPKTADVACIFSDIRGFTESSKDLEEFIGKSVLPEVKASSHAIEQFHGIPRKIGDLIFAYFDHESPALNVVRAVLAGIALSQLNRDMNSTVSSIDINRYILISSGKAVVGNVGGLDSAVEITALGSPVNFLSRLDEATKQPAFARLLERGDIVICEQSAEVVRRLELDIDMHRIDLCRLDVSIRDFPEAFGVFRIKPSAKNWQNANSGYQDIVRIINSRANGASAVSA